MFERFWRADSARTRGEARADLGLAIAQGLIQAQGGRVWAENRAGGGARVGFSLPIAAYQTRHTGDLHLQTVERQATSVGGRRF
jgi:signal transduction histidine kinase